MSPDSNMPSHADCGPAHCSVKHQRELHTSFRDIRVLTMITSKGLLLIGCESEHTAIRL